MLQSIISWVKAHLSSFSSYAAVALSLVGVLMASGQFGPDSTAFHVLGGIVSVLTALGFKALPEKSSAA